MANTTNFLETLLIGLITEAETVVPIFLHSKNAMAAFNLSEPVFNNTLAAVLAAQQANQASQATQTPAPGADPVLAHGTPAS